MKFVYAIDENYNKQAYISISSLLEKISTQCSILIIHKNPETFNIYLNQLEENSYLDDIKVLKFENKGLDFPHLDGSHVSEATYYRLFIDQYLSEDENYYVYLDADVVCINDPIKQINLLIDEMKQQKIPIAARTEDVLINSNTYQNLTKFEKLNMKGTKYFNAGVMIIDNSHFIKNNTYEELREHLINNIENIEFWDQDVLNSYFDGNYVELMEQLNFKMLLTSVSYPNSHIDANVIFLHYQGSWKPWSIRGALNSNSDFYQKYYYKLGLGDYHLINTWKVNGLIYLFNGLLTLKILKLDRPFSFIISGIKSLFENNLLNK